MGAKLNGTEIVFVMVCEMIIFGIYYKPACRVIFIIYLTAHDGSYNTFNILIYVIIYIVLCIHSICAYMAVICPNMDL